MFTSALFAAFSGVAAQECLLKRRRKIEKSRFYPAVALPPNIFPSCKVNGAIMSVFFLYSTCISKNLSTNYSYVLIFRSSLKFSDYMSLDV